MRILAANDDATLIIHNFLSKKGRVGRDYGLIGFDDEPQIRTLGISSMYSAFGSLGRQAVQIASQALHVEVSNAVVKPPPALLSQESTLAKVNRTSLFASFPE